MHHFRKWLLDPLVTDRDLLVDVVIGIADQCVWET